MPLIAQLFAEEVNVSLLLGRLDQDQAVDLGVRVIHRRFDLERFDTVDLFQIVINRRLFSAFWPMHDQTLPFDMHLVVFE